MRTLRFDSTGGASGDMILAALIGLGVDLRVLTDRLAALGIGPFEILATPCNEGGIAGNRVTVTVPEHTHNGHSHPHRHLADIRLLIEKGRLPDRVRLLSEKVFIRLAEAEAAVHGTTPDTIHFHEVGALDAIIDIVGCCLALDLLGVDEVAVGPLPLGHGVVTCAHGVLPIPVPAVVELLKGHPVAEADEPFELVTPTGAALLTTWKTVTAAPDGSAMVRSSIGFGHRQLNHQPNMLRAILLEGEAGSAPGLNDECLILECNLDDTIPELLGSLSRALMERGALDTFLTPVYMKKQRPGTVLTVLCRPADREAFLNLIFAETTTFGIREHGVKRTVLDRRHVTVETPYGAVHVKIGSRGGKDITRAPEHEDCARCAATHHVPVRQVYEAALKAP